MTEPAQVPWKDVIQISSIEVIELDKLRFVNFNFLRALLIGSLSSSIKTFFFTFSRITASFLFLFVTRARHSFQVYREFFKVCLHPH